MSNVLLRDLPPGTLELLKDTAREHGRSLNSELLLQLNEVAERIRRTRDFLALVKPRRTRSKAVDLEALLRADRADREAGMP